MLGIGQRLPAQEIVRAFRYVRNHFEQHDGFVEMIQIIGGQAGAGIDVGGLQLGRPRYGVGAGRARHLEIGLGGLGRCCGHPFHC